MSFKRYEDLMMLDFQPTSMTHGFCPNSVFDKFGFEENSSDTLKSNDTYTNMSLKAEAREGDEKDGNNNGGDNFSLDEDHFNFIDDTLRSMEIDIERDIGVVEAGALLETWNFYENDIAKEEEGGASVEQNGISPAEKGEPQGEFLDCGYSEFFRMDPLVDGDAKQQKTVDLDHYTLSELCAGPAAFNKVDVFAKVKVESIRPETPPGSDEDCSAFATPVKTSSKLIEKFLFGDDDDDADKEAKGGDEFNWNYNYTPNSSPVRDVFNSLRIVNFDHTYNLKTKTYHVNNMPYIVENLGIQTPSASEPATDSDEMTYESSTEDFDEQFERVQRHLKMLKKEQEWSGGVKISAKVVSSLKSTKDAAKKLGTTKKVPPVGNNKGNNSNGGKAEGINCNVKQGKRKYTKQLLQQQHNKSGNKMTVVHFPTTTLYQKNKGMGCDSPSSSKRQMKLQLQQQQQPQPRQMKTSRHFTPDLRSQHNSNEQSRRVELRRQFEVLRELVPNLQVKARAPKVTILQEAACYCDDLTRTEKRLLSDIVVAHRKQKQLQRKLSALRKEAAIIRDDE